MEIGFAAPVSGSWATPDNLTTIGARAEELGYASLWTFQRLLSPPDGSWGEAYRSVLDPVATMAHLAATTSRVRLGVAVLNLPFVPPAVLAKQVATVDVLSRGRVDVGLGIGWADDEFRAVGADPSERGRRADEYLPLLRRLWTEDVVEHHGEFYEVPRSTALPRPVQQPLPMLVGATAPPALRRAGRLADGWISSSRADLSGLDESVRIVREAAERAGRDPAALRFVCRASVRLRDRVTSGERRALTGDVDQIRGDLAILAEQGMTEAFLDPNFDPEIGSPDADPAESMRRADELLTGLAPHGSSLSE